MNDKTLSIISFGNTARINSDELIKKLRFTLCSITYVKDYVGFIEAMKTNLPDIILIEQGSESNDTQLLLGNLILYGLRVPVILLLEAKNEDIALGLLDHGINDYLFFQNLKRLPNAIAQLVDKYEIQRQNNQRYQYLYDQNLAGLYRSSAKGILIDCNAAFASILGYDHPEDLIGRPVKDQYLVAADRNTFVENLRRHGQVHNYENILVRKDGRTIYTMENIYLSIDERSGEEICQGIMLDITQLVTTKQNITRARAMLTEAQKLAGMGNWNYNMRKKELTVSHGLCDILGLSKTDSLSLKQFLSMIDPQDKKQVVAEVLGLKENGGRAKNNFRILGGGGKTVTVAALHTQDLDDEGEVLRYYGVLQDVTALESAEKERDRITAELVKRNQALEQFTYVISHNLRAPVANIKALVEILEYIHTDVEGKDLIERMGRSVFNLDTVITDLNLILQVKQQQNAIKEEIHFETLISSIRLSIKNLIVEEHVKFELDLACASAMVTIRSYIYSIFYNLILNSIKYRSQDREPIIKICCKEEEGVFIIKFEDNGKGIDLIKNGNQIFGLYKRFDTSIDGKGMGLFMVKSQVEELGGTIEVSSELSLGTTFLIRLPG